MRTLQSLALFALVLSSPPVALALQGQVSGRSDDRAVPGTLPVEEVRAWLAEEGIHEPFVPEAPLGITADLAALIPADNPITPAKAELGRQLYFDKRLSQDGTVSCASCHDPARGWTDNLPVSPGVGGKLGGRSSPTIVNRILAPVQFWDGRAASLEEQSLGPIANPVEMAFSAEDASELLNGIEGYRLQFEAIYGGPATPDRIASAIATFERTILSGANRNDYYEQALPFFGYEPDEDEDPAFLERMDTVLDLEATHRMSLAAERGRDLFFGKASCSACHVGQDLSDEDYHNIGIGIGGADLGREAVTGDAADRYRFRTTSLRNIALTAPYMHDGSLATLMEVVEHYDRGGTENPNLSEKIFPLNLTEQERQDLVRFLEEALTGTITEVEVPRLP